MRAGATGDAVMHDAAQRVVVLGGGFAGVELVQRLERMAPGTASITLLSRENYITYNPLLAESVGASILPSHVVAPLRQMVKRARFCMVNVSEIDLSGKQVHYVGEGAGVIDYDHLVLACGVQANLDIIPGMARFALPLKTLGDALFLRNRVIVRLEHADLQPDPALRRWLATFIVIGGGFSGVEVAAEIRDFLSSALGYYRNVTREDCQVILLHATDRILPELPESLSRFALERLCTQGIEVRLSAEVSRVMDNAVMLSSGEYIAGGTVICTVGTRAHPLVEALPVPKQRGRVETAPDLSVPGHPGLWALGDCAAVPNAWDGRTSPPTAQFAVRQARLLAANMTNVLRGQGTRPFHYRPQGQLCSIGHNKAVAEIFGVHLYGFLAWLVWRGVYLLKFPTLARKVRIFLEWNWEMLFPPDIVHLRYSRTPRAGVSAVQEGGK